MPEVHLFMVEGRSDEQKRKVMKAISDAVVAELGVVAEAVTVQIVEAKATDKMKGGVTFVERRKK